MPRVKKNVQQQKFTNAKEAFIYLHEISDMEDEDINIVEAALALGMIFLPGIGIDRYRNQVKKLATEVKKCFEEKTKSKEVEDSLDLRAEVLRKVIFEDNGYLGDTRNFENIDNINFVRLLETRTGIPVSMGILLMYMCDKMKWQCSGINFPGHFLVGMDMDSERLIMDPFDNLKPMEAHDLRELLKSIMGEGAELSHTFYEPVKKRSVLLRLQNNIKARYIESGDYGRAILAVESIETFYPEEYRIYLDKGVLYAKLRNGKKSVEALEQYIKMTPDPNEKYQAEALLLQIKSTMT